MSDLKQTVALTNSTIEKMSRHLMLEWVNSTVHGQYKKIEELCSGVAYCQMMDLLFPNSVVLKKVKINAKMEHEFLHNLKLFQSAFTKLNIEKTVPIDRLMKGKFQDNFEFLQWFKKFFDIHSGGKENLKVPAALAAAAQNIPKPLRRASSQTLGGTIAAANAPTGKINNLKTPKNSKQSQERTISPSSLKVLQETQAQLAEQILNVELERNTFYEKLTKIETILDESSKNDAYVEWCTRALAILYSAEDKTEASCGEVTIEKIRPIIGS